MSKQGLLRPEDEPDAAADRTGRRRGRRRMDPPMPRPTSGFVSRGSGGTAAGGSVSLAAEVGMSAVESIVSEPASHPDAEDAEQRREVQSHRVRDPSSARSGSAKRRRIPRRRHSPSPPAARRTERSSSGGGSTSGGVARGVARASNNPRVSRISAEGSAGGVYSGVSRGRARGGASARQSFVPQ